MRFIKEVYTVSFIVFGTHYVICSLIPNGMYTPYNPIDTQVPNIDILSNPLNTSMLNNTDNQSETTDSAVRVAHVINSAEAAYSTEKPRETVEEFILHNENMYGNMFKLNKHDESYTNMKADYMKLKKLFKTARRKKKQSKEKILNNIYTKTRHFNRIRLNGFTMIGPIATELASVIATEQAKVHTEKEDMIPAKGSRSNFIISRITQKIDCEDAELKHINRQLSEAIHTSSRLFRERTVDYKWFSKNLAISFNILNMINSIRVNRILSTFNVQRLMKFDEEAVNQMEYYKEIRDIELNRNSREMTKEERALDEFNYTLKFPETFKASILNVKFKKTIISSTCVQIINFVLEFKEAIKAVNITKKIKNDILLEFRYSYVYALRALYDLKDIDAYSFDNTKLYSVEESFANCIDRYLKAKSIISNYLVDLKEDIDSDLSRIALEKPQIAPLEIMLSTKNQDDKKTLDQISIFRHFLSFEKNLHYREHIGMRSVIDTINSIIQEDTGSSMKYSTYLNNVKVNNDLIDKIIKKYESILMKFNVYIY
ncbi:hypothetical protein NEPAR03_1806 [Nematocida parisii]|nr:hypothetical protein NEPAR03_1806 [Nematocida parisii]